MQAKDIQDQEIIEAVKLVRGKHGAPDWSSRWDVEEVLSHYPPKVVLAKCRSLIKRGLMKGCTCGCRGDFELIEKGDK